jgi:PleD family two-component response regulator
MHDEGSDWMIFRYSAFGESCVPAGGVGGSAERAPRAAAIAGSPVRLGCEPPRLLIVDDNPANLEIMEARLARQGYEIVTATDGDTALGAARERRQT